MRRERPIEFRTVLILYILLGIVVALTIHFIVLSSERYNWLRNTSAAPATSAVALSYSPHSWLG
jgi:light-harvesting complex 1 alpha chain